MAAKYFSTTSSAVCAEIVCTQPQISPDMSSSLATVFNDMIFVSLVFSSEPADPDISKCKAAIVVALQRDMTFFCAAEIGIRSELARFHFRFPVGTPQF